MPDNKLGEVWRLLKNIESHKEKTDNLTFAGCWKDLDQEIFDNLTINLGKRRLQDRKF